MRALFTELPGGVRQHAADRRDGRATTTRCSPRSTGCRSSRRARGRDAGVVAAQGGRARPGACATATPSRPRCWSGIETEMKVIGPMGFSSYFLVVADICQLRPRQRHPGRPGPRLGHRVDRRLRHPHHRARPAGARPAVRAVPQPRAHQPARRRPRLRRPPARPMVALRHREVRQPSTPRRSTRSARSRPRPPSRTPAAILGYPFAMGDRITKAMPPDVMGKGVPLADMFDENHPRYNEGGEIRALYENDPDVKKVIDTGRGIEGLIRGTGVHAAAVILSSTPLLDLIPMHRRDKDGVDHHRVRLPVLRGHGPGQDGLPGSAEPGHHRPRHQDHQAEPGRRARHR